jgi:iron complex transport system substrate-binding protein
MRRTLFLAALIVACFAISFLAKMALDGKGVTVLQSSSGEDLPQRKRTSCERIVSLAPSITENLYALGMMDRVVGVTRYCDYPPEARTKPEIGGYYDPNYEAIVALDPDLIIMLIEDEDPRKQLSNLGFNVLNVDHRNIPGILQSIESIGEVCGALEKAKSITADLRARMEQIEEKTAGLPPPRVMVSVGRNLGTGTLEDVYISGKEGFYNEMIERLGGINAYPGTVAFPVVSTEGIIQMNPDIIIDMVPDMEEQGWDETQILKEWAVLSHVKAVKNHRVYVFGEDYAAIPGPRFISIMGKMARVMYPEANWE